MYFQITTRCNMSCAHCCFSCTEQGEDMSLDIFKRGLELFGEESITIGGGEPTIHPDFWPMLITAISYSDYVWMATNGSQTETSLKLARLTRKDVICCELSIDEYHDQIDYEVIEAFQELGEASYKGGGYSHIRDVTDKVKSQGRAIETGADREEGCACSGGIIKPNGDIYMCGCEDSIKIGNVYNGIDDKWNNYNEYDCVQDYNAREE